MLQVNFLKDINNTKATTAFFNAVKWEVADMYITLNNAKIAQNDKAIKGGKLTKENKAAKEKDNELLTKDNEQRMKDKENYENDYNHVITSMTSVAKTYTADGKEYTLVNSKDAVRNILRLIACGEKTAFFKIAIIASNEYWETLYESFTALHNAKIEAYGENGTKKGSRAAHEEYKKINNTVSLMVRELFSLPVENDFTNVIRVRFNNSDLGILHEVYTKGINVKFSKKDDDSKECKGLALQGSILKKKNKDGTVTYKADSFLANMAKIALVHLCKIK